MVKVGLLAKVVAKAGMEEEVAGFLGGAVALARAEGQTVTWYAFRAGPAEFGVFDTFAGDEGRQAHLSGEIAKALMGNADRLLAEPPSIRAIDILAQK